MGGQLHLHELRASPDADGRLRLRCPARPCSVRRVGFSARCGLAPAALRWWPATVRWNDFAALLKVLLSLPPCSGSGPPAG